MKLKLLPLLIAFLFSLAMISQNNTQITDYEVCDDDFDGVALFDLTTKDAEVLNGLDPAIATVSYHHTFGDAMEGNDPIASPYQNMTNPETIYVRLTFQGVIAEPMSFDLIVNPMPIIYDLSPYIICDDDGDGFEIFDLQSRIPEILANNNPLHFEVSFYETQADADAGTNGIATSYTNTTNPQTIYVRVDDVFSGCFATTTMDLIVETDCLLVNDVEMEMCAELDIPTIFDLTALESEIVAGQDVTDFSFSYFISFTNAQANVNAIENPDNYPTDANFQIIYVRVENTTNGQTAIAQLYLSLHQLPQASLDETYDFCSNQSIVLTPTNMSQNYTYSWNTGATDPEILVTETGTYAVTITDIITGCNVTISTEVTQSDAPVLNEPSDIESCDGTQVFDLTEQIAVILNGQDDTGLEISFYTTLSDVYNQTNPIPNPESFTVAQGSQTIYVRVNNLDNPCFGFVDFTIFIDNCPVTVNCADGAVNTTYCYDNLDTTEFVFESSDGSPLVVVFNAGLTEVGWDAIYILDSNGTILNADLPYGNNGDFTGLTYLSTGSSLTVGFSSDSIISCASGNACCNEPFDFDVFCANTVGIIDVSAFVDANENTIFDDGETLFSHGYFTYEVNGDGVENVVTSSTGNFIIYSSDETDVYSVSFNLYEEFSGCHEVTTTTFDGISIATGETTTVEFPVVQIQSCEDLAVYLINNSAPPRPGFNHSNYLVLENLGFTTIASGTVEFVHDSALDYLNVFNVNPAYTITATATGFTVDFVNLQPGDSEYIGISLHCPTSVALGDIVTNSATYLTTENDLLETNNYSTLSEVVVNSWDPNDKMESHGPYIVYDEFAASDEYLYYTIRFQNLGTAEAINVRIEDELDSLLDASTFQMLHSSHDNVVTRTGDQLVWQFDGINLPSEEMDEEGSQGYVYFRIQPMDGYSIGTVIPNAAEIYFDFNEAVITNTWNTEFVETLSIADASLLNFSMVPNPANDLVTINLQSATKGKIEIHDIQGKLILTQDFSNRNLVIMDVSSLQSGLYFVKVNNDSGKHIQKLIIR